MNYKVNIYIKLSVITTVLCPYTIVYQYIVLVVLKLCETDELSHSRNVSIFPLNVNLVIVVLNKIPSLICGTSTS